MVNTLTPQERLFKWLSVNPENRDFWIEIIRLDWLRLTMQERRSPPLSWVGSVKIRIPAGSYCAPTANLLDTLITQGMEKWEKENRHSV